MENEGRNKKNNRKMKVFEKYTILLFVITLFMGIAYADVVDVKLKVTGDITAELQDGLFISDIKKTSSSVGVLSEEVKYYKGTTISSRIQLSSDSSSNLNYHVTLYNNSTGKYYFKGIEYINEAYDNAKIIHTADALTPYITTIEGKGTTLEFDLKFKYKDGITVSSSQELNSVLNIVFSDETIEFKVGETKYKAQSGVTWQQFINSNYNTYGFKITNKKVCTKAGKIIAVDGKDIKPEDVISKDLKYNLAPVITLDNETINLEIEQGATGTATLTATVENVTADKLTWKVETANSGITLSGTGLTRTLTATQEIQNAVIKVSYGDYEKTCTVNVTVKASVKKAYSVGDVVTIKNGYVDEEFYVIKDSSESEDTVTLLAKKCIDTENLIQSDNPSDIDFSSDIYWSEYDITTYPYDLVETGVPDPDHYAAYAAYQYGYKLGGSGRLMTLAEAKALEGSYDSVLYAGYGSGVVSEYLLGTLTDYVEGWGAEEWTLGSVYYDATLNYIANLACNRMMGAADRVAWAKIRPVITISKSLFNENENEDEKRVYAVGDRVLYDSDGDGTTEVWIVYTTNNNGEALEIISENSMGNLTLGSGDTTVNVTTDLDGDGTVGDEEDIAIASYNNAITTINNYCKSLVKPEIRDKARSVGASTDTSGNYSSTNFNSWFKNSSTVKVKARDEYYKTDFEKMEELGIVRANASYWFASRYVYWSSDDSTGREYFGVWFEGENRLLSQSKTVVRGFWR